MSASHLYQRQLISTHDITSRRHKRVYARLRRAMAPCPGDPQFIRFCALPSEMAGTSLAMTWKSHRLVPLVLKRLSYCLATNDAMWHEPDLKACPLNGRDGMESGPYLLAVSISGCDTEADVGIGRETRYRSHVVKRLVRPGGAPKTAKSLEFRRYPSISKSDLGLGRGEAARRSHSAESLIRRSSWKSHASTDDWPRFWRAI